MSPGVAADEERDRRFMQRALALARRGRGKTRPNPMVGAVVVRGGRAIGEGYHQKAGTSHAEIHALAGLGRRAAGATLYVTLEPCCHTGRTAPCTEAVIAAGIARVVVAVRDPNPLVDGRGLLRLRRAGIRVDVGCVAEEAASLNRAFFIWVAERRPLVTLKAAATLDGFLAESPAVKSLAARAPVWITGAESRAAAHALRAEHDAILVGAGTVRADDPKLTVRAGVGRRGGKRGGGRSLLRVVLDGRLRTPADSAVLAPVASARTLVVGAEGASTARAAALRRAGAEVVLLPARQDRIALPALLRTLFERDVQSLLVEGGAEVHGAFIAAGLVDRVAFFFAPMLIGGGVPVAGGDGAVAPRTIAGALSLGPLRVRRLGRRSAGPSRRSSPQTTVMPTVTRVRVETKTDASPSVTGPPLL